MRDSTTDSSAKKTCHVVFQPSGRRGAVPVGTSLLDAARQLGVGIEAVCGGQAICGKCVVLVEEGVFLPDDLRSTSTHLSPMDLDEQTFFAQAGYPLAARLACRARAQGDVLVTIPSASQSQHQVVHKTFTERPMQVDPIIRLVQLTLSGVGADVDSAHGRVLTAVSANSGLERLRFDDAALGVLLGALQEGHGALTVTVWNATDIIRVQPGHHTQALGFAVDIGSTTLAAYLCDLMTGDVLATASGMNPQVMFGDDIMSRISYVMEHPQGHLRLHELVIGAINALAEEATTAVGSTPEDIVDVTLVGNSVMHHLALGLDPCSLGTLPFMPVVREPVDTRAADLGLRLHPGARVYVLPLVAGFVGADTVGVLLAEAPHLRDEVTLIIDVGTNGEIVLGNRARLLCASAATGPALEGAQITRGMRAAPGAIERVRIDSQTLAVRFKVIGQTMWSDELPPEALQARGICGSGIIEAVAELFAVGVIEVSGRFSRGITHPRLIQTQGKPAFVLAEAAQTATGKPIVIAQSDVRAMQLAKAALYVGARSLMREFGVDAVQRIALAGAFGTLMDRQRAMAIGMIPDCDLNQVVSVGNAAGVGACLALLSRARREEAMQLARRVEHLTISLEEDFQEQFVAALDFPARPKHRSRARTLEAGSL